MTHRIFAVLLALVLPAALSACGQKGPLYPPAEQGQALQSVE